MYQTNILSTNYQPKAQKQQGLESCQDFFVKTNTKAKTSTSKTKSKTKTLGLKTKTKTKTLFFVLEAPRHQDFGLEDYITGNYRTSYYLLFVVINTAKYNKRSKQNTTPLGIPVSCIMQGVHSV